MKKAVVFLLLFSIVFCCGACKKTDSESTDITEKIAETVAEIISETKSEDVVRIYRNDMMFSRKMSADDSEYIIDFLENSPWDDGTADCLNDYTFVVNEKNYYYHSDCGTFNDNENQRSLPVNEDVKAKISEFISKVYLSETPTAVRDNCYPDGDTEHMHDKNYDYYKAETDGVILEIHAPYVVVPSTEFEVCAIVTNTTDEAITYVTPVYADNSHTEVRVKISDGQNSFTDIDVYGRAFPEACKEFHLKSGESYTQIMHFMPGKITSDIGSSKPDAFFENYKGGDYKGTAVFNYYCLDGGCVQISKSVSVEFPVVLASKKSTFQNVTS